MKLIFIAVTLICSSAYAQLKRPSSSSSGTAHASHHQVGFVVDQWIYKEPVIQDSGLLFGIHYRYQGTLTGILQHEIHAEYLTGNTTYDGQALATGAQVTIDQNNKVYNGYWLFLLDLNSSTASPMRILPVIGVYYRLLIDADDPFLGDYERDQTYFTFPVGINLHMNTWKLQALVHLGFSGKNVSHVEDAGGSPSGTTFTQKNGSGLQVELEKSFGTFSLTAFFRSWDIEASDSVNVTFPPSPAAAFEEPVNTTRSFGARLSLNF